MNGRPNGRWSGRSTLIAAFLAALSVVALASFAGAAFGGPAARGGHGAGGKGAPWLHVDTRAQLVESGDVGAWHVGPLVMRGADAAVAEASFAFAVDQARAAAVAAGQGGKGALVVNDADVLDAEWHDQGGTVHRVHTVKGINEKPKAFVERHVETVTALQSAFPPVPPATGGTGAAVPSASPRADNAGPWWRREQHPTSEAA